jgi:hypothetical protein
MTDKGMENYPKNMGMEVVGRLVNAHDDLEETIAEIPVGDLDTIPVTNEGWTTKDVLSHLTAWNLQYLTEIDGILRDDASWHKLYEDEQGENEFNRKAVEERRNKPFSEIYTEWERSILKLVDRVQQLAPADWMHQAGNGVWKDGSPITVRSLFDYRYNNEPHESGHAKAIRERLMVD